MRRWLLALSFLLAVPLLAQAKGPRRDATPTPTPTSIGGCVETVPSGAQRPALTESFPSRGLSGYAATLRVTVDHGRGESVLPRGLELQGDSEAAKALKDAGFVIPDQDGGGAARLTRAPADPKHADRTSTLVELPLLALPPEPGRHTLTLPPLPIAVARANGEIASVCTKPHTMVVEDPTASTPDAQPKSNPPARAQREEWTALRQVLTWLLAGAILGAIIAYAVRRWTQRPRPAPPPPPPRPPWEIALEKLDEVRHAGLLEVARFQEYFDRVNDAVRAYLGARYGFDGLESTTDEILHELRRTMNEPLAGTSTEAGARGVALPGVVDFLTECDLVKFANVTPTEDGCQKALESAERIVRSTMPVAFPRPSGLAPLDTLEPPVPSRPPPATPGDEGRSAP